MKISFCSIIRLYYSISSFMGAIANWCWVLSRSIDKELFLRLEPCYVFNRFYFQKLDLNILFS